MFLGGTLMALVLYMIVALDWGRCGLWHRTIRVARGVAWALAVVRTEVSNVSRLLALKA